MEGYRLIFKEYKYLFQVKKAWGQLLQNNTKDIYQQYEFNRLFFMYRKTSVSNRKRRNTACRFIVGLEKGEVVCIAPLAIDKTPEKTVRLLGHGTNAGYLDYIYKESRYVEELHNYIKNKYVGYKFDYIFIKEKSPLVKLMHVSETFNNYAIYLSKYEEYFNSLSKSTRQNIRTAYNRMNTDNYIFSLEIYDGNSRIDEEQLIKINELYHKRKADWNGGVATSEQMRKRYLKRDVIFKGARKLDNPVIAVLNINNNIAAFFVGFSYTNGICIPRLAIDTDYGRYSPGMILINEYLKKVSDIPNTGFTFDLCRGDEKYKSSLGGKKSITYRLGE